VVQASQGVGECRLLGPRHAKGASGFSSMVPESKNALAKYSAGEAPDDQHRSRHRRHSRFRRAERRASRLEPTA
jgi:hypothetical protein